MRVVPWEFVHVCTLSAYTLVISLRLATAAPALTGSEVELCFEKTLDMPYYGCSKLLKARAVFYLGTHTRFTVSVGIDLSLTKTRRTRSAKIICIYGQEIFMGNRILLGYVHRILGSM